MWSWFAKKPRFSDIAFQELALMLTQDTDRPVPRRELLRPESMDFSMASLKHLDAYLEVVRHDRLTQENLTILVLRSGAYAGEVIRRHCRRVRYHWLDYQQAEKRSALVRDRGMCLPLVAVLWASNDDMCFPLAKVCKFLENGEQDSLYGLASVIAAKQSQRVTALSD